jgi:hypothetical protein
MGDALAHKDPSDDLDPDLFSGGGCRNVRKVKVIAEARVETMPPLRGLRYSDSRMRT